MIPTLKKFLRNPFLWLFILAILGFWQVSFLYSGVHCDMLDVHLPWLFYMSEVLQSGQLHYWNPYQELGYPFHADLLSTWYLPSLLIARFIGFDLITLHYYFLLHVFIAGAGMYKLCMYFGNEKRISFLGAASYMLCGVMVSNAQHLFIIMSMAWLPFILYYFLRIQQTASLSGLLKLSVAVCLTVTGGYPFLTVVLIYFLIVLALIFIFRNYNTDRKKTLQVTGMYLGSMALSVLLCMPMIISLIQVMPVLERANPLALDIALGFPYTLHAFWLHLIPFAVANDFEYFGSDISMVNCYSGIVLCVFFIYGFFKKATWMEYIFLLFGLFSLACSLSKELPFMKILIAYVPLFNYFRFPALFRLFFIVGAIIFSIRGLRNFLSNFENDRRRLVYCAWVLMGIIAACMGYALWHMDISQASFFTPHETLHDLLFSLTRYERILIGGIIQEVILLSFLIVLFKTRNKFAFLKAAGFLMVLDMFISVQTNVNFTVVDMAVNPVKTNTSLTGMAPKGFPVPKRTNMLHARNEGTGILGIWRNINDFTKEPAVDAYTSFWLKDYQRLEQDTLLSRQALNNSPVYLSASVFSMRDLDVHKQNGMLSHENIYLDSSDYRSVQPESLSHVRTDTAYFLTFGPNAFRIHVVSAGPQVLTLLQSAYKGWKVFVEKKEVPWMKSNYLFMSVLIPKGEYEVKFIYENKLIKTGFIIAATCFVIVLLWIFYLQFRKSRSVHQ